MASFERNDRFENRHIGTTGPALAQMLRQLGVSSLDELIDQTVPAQIRLNKKLQLPPASSEFDYLNQLKINAQKNKVYRSFIGQGYYGTITPSVVRRNVFENPGWYTQYTPYQAEISQGRLEALLNFQTMISDLTGLPISNASLLDEGTAAAEAMLMFFHANEKKNKEESPDKFFVDHNVFDQTIDVLRSRAWPQGIEIIVGDWRKMELPEKCFGVLLQYPDKRGAIHDYQTFIQMSKAKGCNVALATDLLALCWSRCRFGKQSEVRCAYGFWRTSCSFFCHPRRIQENYAG